MDRKDKIIFFDFDGVIADSFDAALKVNKMIFPAMTEERYRKMFDGNINESVIDRDKEEKRTDIDFFTEMGPLLLKSPIFPGMAEVVRQIAKSYTLIIISSTTSDLIRKFLILHGIDDRFEEVMGNDVHTSKVKKIEMALSKYGARPDDCKFITDTTGDIREADHHGIKTIAVTWGYQSKDSLVASNPSALVNTPRELLVAVIGKRVEVNSDKYIFGFWVYLMTDLVIFAALFATYAVLRTATFGGPSQGQLLGLPNALAETLILLTSSFTCGLAMLAVHSGKKNQAMAWFGVTFVLGATFLGLELVEFSSLVAAGNGPQANAALSAFFTLVGTHGLHIAIGLLWMIVAIVQMQIKGLSPFVVSKLERLALFWHFLDIVWIFIFTIVYLIGHTI